MTAPSLLDELEEVVRLAEKATPGPFVVDGYGDVTANGEDVARIASDGYSAYHDAHLFADAANFIRTHHAEIADMAKRLEAAERGAARYRWLRDESLGQWKHPICVSQERSPLGMRYVGPLIGDSLDAAIDAAAAHALMEAMKEFNHAGHARYQNPIYAAMCRADTIMREWGFDTGEDA